MARQKTKLSDRFGSGGNKETSKEASLFGDAELEETPEFKAMHLLMDQIDDLTDVINANDAASGSYATLKNNYTTASGSFSTRVSANDSKVTSQFPAVTHATDNYAAAIQWVLFTPASGNVKYYSLLITVISSTPSAPSTKVVFTLAAS